MNKREPIDTMMVEVECESRHVNAKPLPPSKKDQSNPIVIRLLRYLPNIVNAHPFQLISFIVAMKPSRFVSRLIEQRQQFCKAFSTTPSFQQSSKATRGRGMMNLWLEI